MSYFSKQYEKLSYPISENGSKGFRNAQIGALHSISGHFTLHDKEPAIVVMPTGTGKTGVLMASAFALRAKRVLIITPSKLVREQIANGFASLNLLTGNGILPEVIAKPKVKELKNKIDTQEKWEELEQYDVVVATTFGLPVHLWSVNPSMELFDLLLIDEAHHSPAQTWNNLIQYFKPAKKVMFTATPFRRDKKEIKGKFIYNYPISKAFSDGIFGTIDFIPAIPYLEESHDLTLAKLAEKTFNSDKANGFKHNIMVRTNTKVHAKQLLGVYEKNTKLKLKQVDSTQTEKQVTEAISRLADGTLDGIICVDMLGEGFDFPNLKIGVIHEPHQSLAITLQFIGRFARTNAKNIGAAKFIAIPNEVNFLKLELYAEGAIWKDIIHEISERTIESEIEVRETFEVFEDMPVDFEDDRDVSLYSLKPGFHVKIYDVNKSINIKQLLTIPDNNVDKYFVSTELNVAVFLTKEVKKPRWLTTDELVNVNFNLFIVYYDRDNNLMYINSTRKTVDTYKQIASQYLGENPRQLSTEFVHRVISGLSSPEVFNLGLRNKNAVNNAESYLMKTGSHVQNALKSNELNLYEGGICF
ncbi:DEAD/DEAH box helicase [Pedobacter suwonensis]|uniref:DEAD/DEAH box helicase n=1 Tax=Pedobacter suwonensis TaxID=332999 RepID=UPI0011A91AAF|nr:DEAD/DEAH box helicase family protein [Pedobacter suwonensis]